MKVSDCCGASPKVYMVNGSPDCDSMDYQICPECGDFCTYIDEDDEDKNEPN